MSEPQMVDPHDVVMTGENSFIRLSNDEGKTMTDRVSHWRVLWSPSGQGHAMFIESPLVEGGRAIYADNFGVVRYLQRHVEKLLHAPFADDLREGIDNRHGRLPQVIASIRRGPCCFIAEAYCAANSSAVVARLASTPRPLAILLQFISGLCRSIVDSALAPGVPAPTRCSS